ncbi:ATP-dependent exoDNAse (exonuclease V) beta subunit (contains helicase and exonuclease domains) [Haloplanus vescus]|uniref:DNA 3'-5' helicase n=1 Tax=Haloplanus vescus TaxID=555874 RepID=A0A1H3VVW9_9EURY|nr:ATP-dependent DNA helicase [Haloplanus vescus]SDZ78841.1 ATP-dependent exoDNAse (exonuclease V) beta subunit (contains helicase and exonuclease domains) [Haloplanus vescus]
MTDLEPNDQQRELIDSTDGLYLVDAGAGTGKTFTVTRRYANIVSQPGVEPDDVLLVTFTNNAAAEMRERIVGNCHYGMRELADAPIQTFHSLCHDLLEEHGHAAPTYLGIDDRITGSTRLVEDELVEEALFGEFVDRFSDDHPEYDDFFRALSDPTGLLDLLNQLAAKGVFPDAEGWYRDGERHLDGDFAAFKAQFDDLNEPRNDGRKQSVLRSKLGRYGQHKCYLPDAPEKSDIRGSGKQVPDELARRVFEEDREALKEFVHDVYHEYLQFALRRNYLNFGMLQLFAFVLLCENHALRDEVAFEYVMIDEFQDSSEIQFKLALLLAGTNNVCVVGDWKQSIYSFQYADVDNIVEFESRLDRFVDQLNSDHERITYPTTPVNTIKLVENYRSTQEILDFSEHGLRVPAANRDDVDVDAVDDRIVSLESNADHENTTIEAIQSDEEQEAVLAKIQDIVGNDDYRVEDEDGDLRAPEYGDIAVLTRTRDFGRELLGTAEEYGLPMAYEGGIELFRTDQAKLLLAWLRILEDDADRGWAVVLERAGYTLDEVDAILDREAYPENVVAFREELREMDTLGGVARRVFARYGHDGPTADVVLHTLQSVHDATTQTRGDLVRFVERAIEAGSTHEVHAGAGTDSVTVQTIHATKGLEYPIVVLANMNSGRFPPGGGGGGDITYTDPVGLRQRHVYSAEAYGLPHVYDNWQADVLQKCLPRNYDEERRLLYVAITRAKSHVVFTAGEDPNTFVEELPVDVESVTPDLSEIASDETAQTTFQIEMPVREGPRGHTPHTLMRDDVFEDVEGGRGTEFGTKVHDFAEAYADGEDVAPRNDDEENVVQFLDGLDGELLVEEDAYLPLTVDGERVTISGVVDLVHVTPDRVEIVDYKTDRGRHGEDEYRKQLSVYYHVVREVYPDREITASILYTAQGTRRTVELLDMSEIRALVRDTGTSSADVEE